MITKAQAVMAEMEIEGYKLVGKTSGLMSFRKGSNLARKLESLSLSESEVEVRTGARAGARANDGYELLIFTR